MSKPIVIVEHWPFGDARDSKHIRLIGYLKSVPEAERQQHPCTRIEMVNTASLVAEKTKLIEARDALRKRVEGYARSWTAAQKQLKEL